MACRVCLPWALSLFGVAVLLSSFLHGDAAFMFRDPETISRTSPAPALALDTSRFNPNPQGVWSRQHTTQKGLLLTVHQGGISLYPVDLRHQAVPVLETASPWELLVCCSFRPVCGHRDSDSDSIKAISKSWDVVSFLVYFLRCK